MAAHVVEATNGDGLAVTGTSLTRGGSAKSTSELPARAAVELLEGQDLGAGREGAGRTPSRDANAFLAALDTEVW